MLPRVEMASYFPSAMAQRETFSSGALRSCVPLEPFTVRFGGKELVAQYREDPPRKNTVQALEFHSGGGLKGITLQEPTFVDTPVGRVQAERLTFHADGSLRRVFATAGKPSAVWTEEDEKAHSPQLSLTLPVGTIETRLIGLCFYPSGKLRSATLWPGETVPVPTPLGSAMARIGIAFYESGVLRSFEPARPLPLATPLGRLVAFHALASGIHGDQGSVEFAPEGTLRSLRCESSTITLRDRSGSLVAVHKAREIPSRCEEDATERVPMLITFASGSFSIDGESYATATHVASVEEPIAPQRQLPVFCSG